MTPLGAHGGQPPRRRAPLFRALRFVGVLSLLVLSKRVSKGEAMTAKWLIERTDVTPPLYLAHVDGKLEWVEDANAALGYSSKAAADSAWSAASGLHKSLTAHAKNVEAREHQFG